MLNELFLLIHSFIHSLKCESGIILKEEEKYRVEDEN